MKTKKLKYPVLVFFFFLGITFILWQAIIEKIRPKEKNLETPEKEFCRAEIAKIDSVISIYDRCLADTNHVSLDAFKQREEIKNLLPCLMDGFTLKEHAIDMGFIRKVYPDDSTVVVYSIDSSQLMIHHLNPQGMTTDSITDACYIAGKKTSLEEFKKYYPYPFGK
jgi:hypothetical protein